MMGNTALLADNLTQNSIEQGKSYDVVIIGAGPAGLSAAAQAKKLGLNHVVLEGSENIADTIRSFAQGKWIMDEPLSIPQRSEMTFKANSRESILKSWQREVAKRDLNILYDRRVQQISRGINAYSISCQDGSILSTSKIIIATGIQGSPVKVSPQLDPGDFVSYQMPKEVPWTGRRILVVGAGDSAVEEAMLLSTKNKVLLLNRKQTFERCKAGNRTAIQAGIENGELRCFYESEIVSVARKGAGAIVKFKTPDGIKKIFVDHVLARIGAHSPKRVLSAMGLDLEFLDNGSLKTDQYGETSSKGVFAVGSVTGQALIKQGMNQGVVAIERISGNSVQSTEMMMLGETLTKSGIKNRPEEFSRALSAIPLFSLLGKAAIDELLMYSQVSLYKKNTEVISLNDYLEDLFVVIRGKVIVTTESGEKHSITKNEVFGELTLLSKQASKLSFVAQAGTVVVRLTQPSIGKLVCANTEFRYSLNKLFLKRVLKWVMLPNIPAHLLTLCLKKSVLKTYNPGETVDSKSKAVHILVNGSAALTYTGKFKLIQGGGLIGFEEALAGKGLPGFEVKQKNTLMWELPVSLLRVFKVLNPNFGLERLQANKGLVANPIPHVFGVVDPTKLSFYQEQDLGNAGNVLAIDKQKCVACDQCEVACASTHDGISRLDRKAGVKMDNMQIASACRHCKNPDCLTDCPADAITRKASGEIVISDKCIGCGNCAGNCPYKVITLAEVKPKSIVDKIVSTFGSSAKASQAVKCDLCIGRKSGPACVQACPTGAAQRVNPQSLIQAVNL